MRNLPLILVLLAAPGWAQPLSQGERDFAMSQLHATRKLFLDAIDGLSPAQWSFQPDGWSIAAIAAHVVESEDIGFRRIQQALKTPAVAAPVHAQGDDHGRDQDVFDRMADRNRKLDTSAPPKAHFKSPAAAAEAFRQRRDRAIRYVETTQDDLRAHAAGGLDACQMLIALAGDTQRWVEQIEQIKANPRYPK